MNEIQIYIVLNKNETYQLNLGSNSSTGCSWMPELVVPSVIDAEMKEYVQFNGPPGTPGMEKWSFTALSTGQEVVKLSYGRDENDVYNTVEIHFKIK